MTANPTTANPTTANPQQENKKELIAKQASYNTRNPGYLKRTQIVDSGGKFSGYNYNIFEKPQRGKP